MKTASWFTYTGPGRIGISRGVPRKIGAGFCLYKKLAPTRDMMKMEYGEYRHIYFAEILGRLDPAQVAKDLERLADGHEPVLLCWEKPPLDGGNWCHRRMVAEWFENELGLVVPEMPHSRS